MARRAQVRATPLLPSRVNARRRVDAYGLSPSMAETRTRAYRSVHLHVYRMSRTCRPKEILPTRDGPLVWSDRRIKQLLNRKRLKSVLSQGNANGFLARLIPEVELQRRILFHDSMSIAISCHLDGTLSSQVCSKWSMMLMMDR